MSLETFLHHLHVEVEKAIPPDWEPDWEDAPLPYKLYRNLPAYPFSLEVPLRLEESGERGKLSREEIGHFLWYTYGLTQVSQSPGVPGQGELMQAFRRFVPSGGALYPNELYLYLRGEEGPDGIYHYDVARHRLVLLREGNVDAYLGRALGGSAEIGKASAVVFVTTMFWKNFFKYHNFSYRLQGLDTGVLLGQMQEVAARFGMKAEIHFQFLDRALNHLLGLSEREESVYAVVPLSAGPAGFEPLPEVTEAQLLAELPAICPSQYVRSKNVKDYPLLLAMNEASMCETTDSFLQLSKKEEPAGGSAIDLPPLNKLGYDFTEVCRKRFSPEMDFMLKKVSQEQLATLFKETASVSYPHDLGEEGRLTLYACLHQAEGLDDGAYRYDSKNHALIQLRPGDLRAELQYGMSVDTVNLQQVPLCFHIAGDTGHYLSELGYRGYRIQQMQAGILVQKLLLTAGALGMGGHPLLGFDVKGADDIYQCREAGQTCLIQIPVGFPTSRPWLKGSLSS